MQLAKQKEKNENKKLINLVIHCSLVEFDCLRDRQRFLEWQRKQVLPGTILCREAHSHCAFTKTCNGRYQYTVNTGNTNFVRNASNKQSITKPQFLLQIPAPYIDGDPICRAPLQCSTIAYTSGRHQVWARVTVPASPYGPAPD